MLRTEIYNEIVSRVKIAPFDQSVPMVKTDMRKYQQQVDALVKLWQDTIQESLSQSIPKGDARYGRCPSSLVYCGCSVVLCGTMCGL